MNAIRKLFRRRATCTRASTRLESTISTAGTEAERSATEAHRDAQRELDEHIYEEICLEPRHSCTESLFNTRLNQFHRLMHQQSSTEERVARVRVLECRDASTQCDDGTCSLPTTVDVVEVEVARLQRQIVPINDRDELVPDSVQRHRSHVDYAGGITRRESEYVEYNPPDSVSLQFRHNSHISRRTDDSSEETTASGTSDSGCCQSSVPRYCHRLAVGLRPTDVADSAGQIDRLESPSAVNNRPNRSGARIDRIGADCRRACADLSRVTPTNQMSRQRGTRDAILSSLDRQATYDSAANYSTDQNRQRIEKWLADVKLQTMTRAVQRKRRQRRRKCRNRWIVEQSFTVFEVVI